MKRFLPIPYLVVCILALFCFSSVSAQDYRDVVFLKNGSVIKGFYQELYPSDSLRLTTIDGGVFICSMNDVERIAKERSSMYVIDTSDMLKHDHSEWRHRGYRGSIENGNNTNTDDRRLSINSIVTIHGYQFNQYLFLGLGVGIEQISYKDSGYTLYLNQNNIPIMLDARLYLVPRAVSPVIDVRYGYTVSGIKDVYFNPSIGVDFSISPRCGIYLLAGFFNQKYEYGMETYYSKSISFRVGFHF